MNGDGTFAPAIETRQARPDRFDQSGYRSVVEQSAGTGEHRHHSWRESGGVLATVTLSGLANGLLGVNRVSVTVPPNAPTGDAIPVVLAIGGVVSNTVTIARQ